MNSVMLLPYCPLPINTGARREMWKHIDIAASLGSCRILSASTKPVGAGWSPDDAQHFRKKGLQVTLREETESRSLSQWQGLAYAAVNKALGRNQAFPHDNPYHRSAFTDAWWRKQTSDADLAIIHYSYWAHLPCDCPKVIILHDLLSGIMTGSPQAEIDILREADLVVVISRDEENILREAGLTNVLCSPPLTDRMMLPDAEGISLTGSDNAFNKEGLEWLEAGLPQDTPPIDIYGSLSSHTNHACFRPHGSYDDVDTPYRDAGIILIPTAGGTGVQIKLIEALAAGRAIVLRKGAARGLPSGDGAWIEVDDPSEMAQHAQRLKSDADARTEQATKARAYYTAHLDSHQIRTELEQALRSLTV